MSPIEQKRKELELIKVAAARHEIEFRIMEREEEIDRLKNNVQAQLAKEAELIEEIKKFKK